MLKTVLIFFIFLLIFQSNAQVGIGTTVPDNSSVLDISSTDKGLLVPRMTTTQRDAISSPAKGLIVYNLTEDCLQTNTGSSSSPNWDCLGASSSSSVVENNCEANGFEGTYVESITLTTAEKFSVTITNNTFESVNLSFAVGDLVLSGVGGITINSVSPTSATVTSGSSQVVEYTLTGTPASTGTLTGEWTLVGLNCTKSIEISSGDATFDLPNTGFVVSTLDGSPLVDIQGVIDNVLNQITIDLPYSGGVGTYEAYTSDYVSCNANTGQNGDINSFRIRYLGGTFSANGSITATVEVDGDGSFNVKKQLFGVQETIASMDFKVNGNSKGNVNLNSIGGIPDRNFSDPDHKFIYVPVVAADGNTWLNNNLGANYANIKHNAFNPIQQATSIDDHHAYGSSFQWGRGADGHELITYTNGTTATAVNGTTTTNATTDTPGDALFIIETNSPQDWRIPQNDNLWQGESGTNNPCPVGYRVPTRTEILNFASAEGVTDASTAYSSSLAFSYVGFRHYVNGAMFNVGTHGQYWTSSVFPSTSTQARYYTLLSGLGPTEHLRGYGHAVRCIKD